MAAPIQLDQQKLTQNLFDRLNTTTAELVQTQTAVQQLSELVDQKDARIAELEAQIVGLNEQLAGKEADDATVSV